MTDIKLTTWNIEHFARVLAGNTPQDQNRRQAIASEITQIDPDILCIIEGPGDLTLLQDFVNDSSGLNGNYQIPVINGTNNIIDSNPQDVRDALSDLYQMQGNATTGNQWIWFLVKNDLVQSVSNVFLQDPQIWDQFVGSRSWPVHYWGDMSTRNHRHWRHPQVLVIELNIFRVEFIGIHLKSKINRSRPFDANGNLLQTYVEKAIKARIKLATEAENVRKYINARFRQEATPRIFVLGDANDGPGKRFFEQRFLFFDLLSSLQGDVFFARRFLNHCLFDYEDRLRWSTDFRDPVNPDERLQLIDHILFTQSIVSNNQFPRVESGAGFVEHTIHETINAALSGGDTSDHHPVSVTIRWDAQ